MEKTVGKFIIFFLLGCTLSLQASNQSIVLSIVDMNDKPIQQVMVHSRFILKVTLHNIEGQYTIPSIPGIDQFVYSSAGSNSNSFISNGISVTKNTYKYIMQSDTQGLYSIGPVSCTDRFGNVIRSNNLTISVGREMILEDIKTSQEKYQITAAFDKKTVYIGEKVALKISFFDYNSVDQYSLQLPEFENLIIGQGSKEVKNYEINNQKVIETQWIIDCYPKEIGTLVQDGISVRFLDFSAQNSNPFARFGFMMNMQQELVAHPIPLEVLALPDVQGFQGVTAVGQFLTSEISLNVNSVEMGKGIILSYDIFGDGNFDMINSLELVVPEGFTSYDSGSATINKQKNKKHFEYVVQAQVPGQYTIPSQKFSYFDPIAQQYKTIQSNEIEISILPNSHVSGSNQSYDTIIDIDNDFEVNEQDEINNYELLLEQSSSQARQIIIPLSWYRIFLYCLYILFMSLVMYRHAYKYLIQNKKLRHFIIFFQANRLCRIAEKNGDVRSLHTIFINLFVHLGVGTVGSIHDVAIENFLKNKGFSAGEVTQWRVFYNKLLHVTFFTQDNKKHIVLYKDAFAWIDKIKEVA